MADSPHLLRLPPRQEHDGGDSWRHGALEGAEGELGALAGGGAGGVVESWQNHLGLAEVREKGRAEMRAKIKQVENR